MKKYLLSLFVGLALIVHSVVPVFAGRGDPPPQDYQLNLSHISCTEDGQTEIHFALIHINAGDVLSDVSFVANGSNYTAPLTNQNAHEAGFTAYLPAGTTYNVTSASVTVNGVAVDLHNPGDYNDVLCGEDPTEVPPTDVPPTDVPPTDVPPTNPPPTDIPGQNTLEGSSGTTCDGWWVDAIADSQGSVTLEANPSWSGPWGDQASVTVHVDAWFEVGEPLHLAFTVTMQRPTECGATETPIPSTVTPTATQPGPTDTPAPGVTPTNPPATLTPPPGAKPVYFSIDPYCVQDKPVLVVGMSQHVKAYLKLADGTVVQEISQDGTTIILDPALTYVIHPEYEADYWMVDDAGRMDTTIVAGSICSPRPAETATQPVVKGGGAGRTASQANFPVGEFGGGLVLALIGLGGLAIRKRPVID